MKIELAKSAGFCFGVKRAVDAVYKLVEETEGEVCTLGSIIHNEQVVQDLAEKGVRVIGTADEITDPGKATLVIRSHGVSRDIICELEEKGISYRDETCPFVKKIHDTVSLYSKKGYQIIIIGSESHPEIQGILGWTEGKGTVIETPEEAEGFSLRNPAQKICIVAQTTFNYKKFKDLVEII